MPRKLVSRSEESVVISGAFPFRTSTGQPVRLLSPERALGYDEISYDEWLMTPEPGSAGTYESRHQNLRYKP